LGATTLALNLLWATDGSEASEDVLGFLDAFFLPATAAVTVLTVGPHPILSGARPDPARLFWDLTPSLREKAAAATIEIAEAAVQRLASSPARVESMTALGSPIDQIIRVATESEADMIAVGSRGHSALTSLVLGSVSFGVLVWSPCSVLVAKPKQRPPRQILFATDGSPFSRTAENLLTTLAKPPDAKVTVVSVAEPFEALAGVAVAFAPEALDSIRREREAAAREYATAAAGRLGQAGWQTRHLTRAGHAASAILEAEHEVGADMIVIGSRGRTGANAYVLGGVAQTVAHHSHAAVLIVKAKLAD
jgi:nucleotide-binding universal stress UspA family protein